MFINIAIVVLTAAFLIATYYQNSLYSTDMDWEKRSEIATRLSVASPIILAIDSYLLAKKTETLFEYYHWIDLCMFYYMIGFIGIQMTFYAWGKWRMNKYHEAKKLQLNDNNRCHTNNS
jgi:hypothetical protein